MSAYQKFARSFACIACLYLCFAKCGKDKFDADGLPLATQSGKNTYGFLLNSEPWLPRGVGPTPNLVVFYDPSYAGGSFNLRAYREVSSDPLIRQVFTIWGGGITAAQLISLPNPQKIGFSYSDGKDQCRYDSDDSTTELSGGYFDVKKVDLLNRIFAGEFELIFKSDSCQEMRITKGRFDFKF